MRNFVTMAGVLLIACACSSLSDDRAAIAETLQRDFDQRELDIEPIVVRQTYAIAGWVRGNAGGRVLLHREKGQWKIVGQAGEEMRDAQFLKQAGVPQQEASALANVLITAERRLPETRLALLDRNVAPTATR